MKEVEMYKFNNSIDENTVQLILNNSIKNTKLSVLNIGKRYFVESIKTGLDSDDVIRDIFSVAVYYNKIKIPRIVANYLKNRNAINRTTKRS